MRLLVDESLPRAVAETVVRAGHEVLHVAGSPLSGLDDTNLWQLAAQEERVVVTRDLGFAWPWKRPAPDAAELVLTGELPEPEGHFRILQAVALGRTRAGEIGNYARVAVERPLKRLLTLEILQRRVPALDHPARTKRAIYWIRDPYFAFWFRFIASNRDKIARGLGPQLVNNVILPGLDDHMGGSHLLARDHARALVAGSDLQANGVESWWSSDGAHEIDIVGLTGRDRIAFVGSVKWAALPLGQSALRSLTDHAHALPGYVEVVPHLLYGRAGGGERVSDRPEVRCFSIDDLYSTS